MKTVKIYKVTCTNAFLASDQGTGFSLSPWGSNTPNYQGYDDGGRDYVLPDGYIIAKSEGGSLGFYDFDDDHCPLDTQHGKPVLLTSAGSRYLRAVRK